MNELKDDFYMTEQIFGEGIPERYYIISKKLYRLMEQEHMNWPAKVNNLN